MLPMTTKHRGVEHPPHQVQGGGDQLRQGNARRVQPHEAKPHKDAQNTGMGEDLLHSVLFLHPGVHGQTAGPHEDPLGQHKDGGQQRPLGTVEGGDHRDADKAGIGDHGGVFAADLLIRREAAVQELVEHPVQQLDPKGRRQRLKGGTEDLGGQIHLEGGQNGAGQHHVDNQVRELLPGGRGDPPQFSQDIPHRQQEKQLNLQRYQKTAPFPCDSTSIVVGFSTLVKKAVKKEEPAFRRTPF